jgi:hypothetical protein
MWETVLAAFRAARSKVAAFFSPVTTRLKHILERFIEPRIRLSYFDEALAVELHAINDRRRKIAESERRPFTPVRKLEPVEPLADGQMRPASPALPAPAQRPSMTVHPNRPDPLRTRPQPIPCTAVGVALSGGGIRSAAFSLGALQALDFHGVTRRTDYLSTVSGGGYIGTCLTASMSQNGGEFPFGGAADVRDNDAIGHIRNYSNYLMPRAQSALRNALDVASILLRGLLANSLIVLTFLLAAACITFISFPNWGDLPKDNFALRLLGSAPGWLASLYQLLVPDAVQNLLSKPASWLGSAAARLSSWVVGLIPSGIKTLFATVLSWLGQSQFILTGILAAVLAVILIYWAVNRSTSQDDDNDVNSWTLAVARVLLGLTLLSLVLDLQPLFIHGFVQLFETYRTISTAIVTPAAVISGAVTVALFARRLGAFLETTEITALRSVRVQRFATQVLLIVAGLVLPLVLLALYWIISALFINDSPLPPHDVKTARALGFAVLLVLTAIMWAFEANSYSLHQFYKDRLGKAFLFRPHFPGRPDPPELRRFKLSRIRTVDCPYQIINAALNVQGSKEANRRGRNADFFSFTRDFVGSDLTHFAATASHTAANDMETVDRKLDLGSAMAISGAAISANMGSNTLRWLSPTLALLNIRLGYWLRNPRDLAKHGQFFRPREWFYNFIGKFYLLLEMFNFLDENNRFIYLTDGGHIENLGVYQLLKRGCRLIIAIDAEADPEISCSSLLKLERYARIDLGIRIVLPWEQIRACNRATNHAIDPATLGAPARRHGPHSALGPILYEDGSHGIPLYFKSSLSGDEKDYLLDYKKRNLDFPHETTGDQFFTEEQFEVYRALGYHVVEGYFSGTDEVSWLEAGHGAWASLDDANGDVRNALHGFD